MGESDNDSNNNGGSTNRSNNNDDNANSSDGNSSNSDNAGQHQGEINPTMRVETIVTTRVAPQLASREQMKS